MIRKLKSGKYRLYSREKNRKTGKRRNLGTFDTHEAAEKQQRGCSFSRGSSGTEPPMVAMVAGGVRHPTRSDTRYPFPQRMSLLHIDGRFRERRRWSMNGEGKRRA
jgi:hypothetical protein